MTKQHFKYIGSIYCFIFISVLLYSYTLRDVFSSDYFLLHVLHFFLAASVRDCDCIPLKCTDLYWHWHAHHLVFFFTNLQHDAKPYVFIYAHLCTYK